MVNKVLFGIILFACAARFIGLEESPPGFFYDEATGAAHSVCYQQTGSDLFGRREIFTKVDFSGFQSAPFIVGGAVWTQVFGTDFAGFRSFVAFIGVITILGVFYLTRGLTRSHEKALWATALAACLPWAFQFSRISWDAPLGVAFLIWGLVFIYRKPASKEFTRTDWMCWACAGALLTLASYTYSPIRLQTGLMLLLLPHIRWQARALVLVIFGLGNIGVLLSYSDPEIASRAQLLALTSDDPRNPFRDADFLGLLSAYFNQMLAHFSPQFLLISGDMNLRHSIQTHGMLDWVTFSGLLVGVYLIIKAIVHYKSVDKNDTTLMAVCVLGIFAGITPAALTWDSNPHALRAIGAWPFFVILAGFGLSTLLKHKPAQLMVSGLVMVLFAIYLRSFMINYPTISQFWFDVDIVKQIQSQKTFPDNYLPVVRAYYRMTEFGETCEEVRASLEF